MSTIRRSRMLIALGALALIPASLTACSGGGQSVDAACKTLESNAEALQSEMSDLTSGLSSDPSKLGEAFTKFGEAFDKVGDGVTNKEVKDTWDTLSGGVSKAFDSLKDLDFTDPSAQADMMDDLNSLTTDMEAASDKLTDLCGETINLGM